MEEKQLVEKVRNSIKAKKSYAEILHGFQRRGFKLAYADKIINKANRPKKVFISSILILIIFTLIFIAGYPYIQSNQKMDISNPLIGFTITGNAISDTQSLQSNILEITPEFISYLLNEIGVWKLHKNPLTFEKPIINFKIGDKTFYSEIGSDIETFNGLSQRADININIDRENFIELLSSDDTKASFKQSIIDKEIKVEILASKTELFSKGYNKLHDSLK